MSKLINTPTECGYRKQQFAGLGFPVGHMCDHPGLDVIHSCTKNFPSYCPLEEGLPKNQYTGHKKKKEDVKRKT